MGKNEPPKDWWLPDKIEWPKSTFYQVGLGIAEFVVLVGSVLFTYFACGFFTFVFSPGPDVIARQVNGRFTFREDLLREAKIYGVVCGIVASVLVFLFCTAWAVFICGRMDKNAGAARDAERRRRRRISEEGY